MPAALRARLPPTRPDPTRPACTCRVEGAGSLGPPHTCKSRPGGGEATPRPPPAPSRRPPASLHPCASPASLRPAPSAPDWSPPQPRSRQPGRGSSSVCLRAPRQGQPFWELLALGVPGLSAPAPGFPGLSTPAPRGPRQPLGRFPTPPQTSPERTQSRRRAPLWAQTELSLPARAFAVHRGAHFSLHRKPRCTIESAQAWRGNEAIGVGLFFFSLSLSLRIPVYKEIQLPNQFSRSLQELAPECLAPSVFLFLSPTASPHPLGGGSASERSPLVQSAPERPP